jgi:adenylate cyclase
MLGRPMARLILLTNEGQQAIDLRPVNSLGRHPSNTIQLLDKIVSKEHCIIEQRGQEFVLRDLGSLNGTYINNERVRGEQGLKHGDEIALGATRARFEDGGPTQNLGQPAWGGAPGPGAIVQQGQPGQAGQGAQAGANYPRGYGPASQAYPPSSGGYGQAPGSYGGPQTPQGHPPQQHGQQPPGYPQPASRGQYPPQSTPQSGQPGYPAQGYPQGQPQQQQPGYPQGYPQQGQPQQPGFAYPGQQPQGGPPQFAGFPNYGQQQPNQGGTAPLPLLRPGQPGQPGGPQTSFLAQGTRIDLSDQARQIGTQINAVDKGFQPFERIGGDVNQLRADYERLRMSHELTRDIGVERDTQKLLDKVLNSILKFVSADRAVIFLKDESTGDMTPQAMQRRDGTQAPITVSQTILNHVVKERAAVLTHDAAMDFAASKGKSMILNRISSAIVAPLLQHDNQVLGVLWLDSETLARFQAKDLELVQTVANQAARFIEINILGKKVEAEIVMRERFSRLLSPNIAEQVISGKLEIKQGGQSVAECTVFNSDIRGFTRMSEGTTPEILVEMLNEYFELMVDTVFKFEGTLDKFMGDGIMAIWGAPVSAPDDAIRSVDCALEMGQALGAFNRRRLEKDQSPLAVGVGIHTGPLVAGYIGSSKALSYTVIGDTANTSARLCSHALAGQIIVSEPTLAKLKGRFEVEELTAAKVKGKERPLRIYNVLRHVAQVQVPGNASGAFGHEPTSASSAT